MAMMRSTYIRPGEALKKSILNSIASNLRAIKRCSKTLKRSVITNPLEQLKKFGQGPVILENNPRESRYQVLMIIKRIWKVS